MELLLRRSAAGHTLMGSDLRLLIQANAGDDLTICIEGNGQEAEYVVFDSYVVASDRVYGLGLPHIACEERMPANDASARAAAVVQHIHDSRENIITAKDYLDDHQTLTTLSSRACSDQNYTWYSTRRYVEKAKKVETLRACGDQCKILITLRRDFRIVTKPDIVYFPYEGRQYLVKSSAMILPSEFALAPDRYIRDGRPFTESQSYSLAYLNVGSDNLLTIIHKRRFTVSIPLDRDEMAGTLDRTCEGRTGVTHIKCDHTILTPA